jgi:hypothetical protein
MTIDRRASESGGRRDVREDMKTRAAVRLVMIPDVAIPAVRRLLERGAAGREHSNGQRYARLINGDRGGYLGYATWRKYLALAHGYTAAPGIGPRGSHVEGAVIPVTRLALRLVRPILGSRTLITRKTPALTCTNVVGDTGIEPVTSTVSTQMRIPR